MSRVLLADDDPDFRRAFASALEALGHDVTALKDGGQVVATVEMANPPFDVVFLDLMMPEGGGATTLHRLHGDHADLPVVLITGRDELYDSPLFLGGLRYASERLRKNTPLKEIDALIRRLTAV
ncbi:response regulator transcription factor [Rhodobacter sp. TJ_12]|uniref:response regulator transcription factor n=1 Tax=Rhodobacter sp. TJ_12 TaxID=2029399 RepID=UPI001CC078C7|nr:response regulator [Rhodobacter sp. TJ_12]